ncbi:hypothetical protein ACVBEQ_21185 [Nakamurella sp. GG22]
MKRHALFAILMAICLAVSGCTSDAADSTGSQSATSPHYTTAHEDRRTSSDGSTPLDAPSVVPTADSSAAGGPTSEAQTSESPRPETLQPVAPASPSAAVTPQRPTSMQTVPTPSDSQINVLDPGSVRWFTTFCSTMANVDAVRNNAAEVNVGDAASMQSALIGSLTTLADLFDTSTSTMAGLKPPAVPGGDQLNSTITKAFRQYGQRFTASAAKLAAANPEDTLAQADATRSLQSDTQHAIDLTNTVRDLSVNSTTRAAIRDVVPCRGLAL